MNIHGIHHITAIASDPQRNLDFYTRVMGLRLVKHTVNFDVPGTYHFYFADATGNPGTILTFFLWPDERRGTQGTGQAGPLAFSIPNQALGYWVERLKSHNLNISDPFQRFDEEGISFRDPDGLQVELIAGQATEDAGSSYWEVGGVPPEVALRGFHSVTLFEEDQDATAELLENKFGFNLTHASDDRLRLEAPAGYPGRRIDLVRMAGASKGQMGTGIIHHIAWRAVDDAAQLQWREKLLAAGIEVTQVYDRKYFHSIYFHEPGGVQFEIATDPPGFTIDEDADCLGTSLMLPAWLESERANITQRLPQLHLPVLCPELA